MDKNILFEAVSANNAIAEAIKPILCSFIEDITAFGKRNSFVDFEIILSNLMSTSIVIAEAAGKGKYIDFNYTANGHNFQTIKD